jgi:hypothetical protein
MAFPQETFLKARWSDDQSATIPSQPAGRLMAAPGSVRGMSTIDPS